MARARGVRWAVWIGLALAVSVALSPTAAHGETCYGAWLPGQGPKGLDGPVFASVALANGDVIVGGGFTLAAGVPAQHVARYTPATGAFSPLGLGLDGQVWALAVLHNGDVVAAGSFTHSGASETPHIARWTGTAWQPLGTGFNDSVFALVVTPTGGLYAGGEFTQSGAGTPMRHVARWNGSAWSPVGRDDQLPGTYLDGEVDALLLLPDGQLIAGGTFVSSVGGAFEHIARWDGTRWNALGTGIGAPTGGGVRALARLDDGEVVAAGSFTAAGVVSAQNVAVWNGSSWAALGAGLSASLTALRVLSDGELLAGGGFFDSSGPVASWNGATWSRYGVTAGGDASPVGTVYTLLELATHEVLVGGIQSFAIWSSTAQTWTTLAGGFSGAIRAFATFAGSVVAGGDFEYVGTTRVNHLARWNGSAWVALGGGTNGVVEALAVSSDGKLVAGGTFTSAGGLAAGNVAAWNGSAWSALGIGTNGPVHALAVLADGSLVAGGAFSTAGTIGVGNLARWDGSSWVFDFAGGVTGEVFDLRAAPLPFAPRGVWVAGNVRPLMQPSAFGLAYWVGGGGVDKWIEVLNALGGTGEGIASVAVLPAGDVVVGGKFTRVDGVVASSIARRSFLSPGDPMSGPLFGPWTPLGVGLTSSVSWSGVRTVAVRPNGELLVGGDVYAAAGVGANGVASWDGSAWRSLGHGLDGSTLALLPLADGGLLAGGAFAHAGYGVSASYAQWTPPLGTDFDGDGADDACDNCRYTANASQADSGGVGRLIADGVGDACQCGDVTGDGRVLDVDLDAIRLGLAGDTSFVQTPERCSVTGPVDVPPTSAGMRRDCNAADLTVLQRTLMGFAPTPAQVCDPAVP